MVMRRTHLLWLNMGMETQRDRLIFARKEAGFRGFRTAATALKVNENTYKAHEQGRNNFDYEQAKIYGERFGFEPLWLFSGEGPMRVRKPKLVSGFDPDAAEPIQADDPTSVALGVRLNDNGTLDLPAGTLIEHAVYGGAGNGGYAMEVAVGGQRGEVAADTWTFPPAFLKNELHLSLTASDIVRVRGDSMEPTLWDGDRVIVDRTDTDVRVDGIFAILDEGSLIIKQVEIVRGTDPVEIVCKSRNTVYSTFNLVLDGNTRIIGRVVARIGRV